MPLISVAITPGLLLIDYLQTLPCRADDFTPLLSLSRDFAEPFRQLTLYFIRFSLRRSAAIRRQLIATFRHY